MGEKLRRLKTKESRKVSVGGLLLLAIVAGMIAIVMIGGEEGLLHQRYELRTRMKAVNGLESGAPVWLSGVNVGNVSRVYFVEDDAGSTKVEVVMKVRSSAKKLIRRDSHAYIGTLGLLGDKYIALTPGNPDSAIAKPGSYLKSDNPVDIERVISQSVGTINDLKKAGISLKHIAAKIDTGAGTLGKLINEPMLYYSLSDLVNTTKKIENLIKNNEGTIGRLFNDTTLYTNLTTSLDRLSANLDTLQRSKGTLKMLLNNPALYHRVDSTITNINKIVSNVESGKGTAGKLLSDEKLYERLNNSIESLDSLVADIKRNPSKYITVKVKIF